MIMRLTPWLAFCAIYLCTLGTGQAQTYQSHVIYLPEVGTYALDLGNLAGEINSFTTDVEPDHVSLSIADNDNLEVESTRIGIDSLVVTYCDGASNCDSVAFVFDVRLRTQITADTQRDTVVVGEGVVTSCVDTSQLPGTVVSAVNACEGQGGPYVEFALDEASACLKYRGIGGNGTDTACVVVCDDLGFCDTTTVIVTVVEPATYPDREIFDVIYAGLTETRFLDVSDFPGAVVAITNTCPDASGTYVDFLTQGQTSSVQYSGLERGVERACLQVTDADGRTQNFFHTVTVLEPTSSADTLLVRNGSSYVYCFEDYELSEDPIDFSNECSTFGDILEALPLKDITCLDLRADGVGAQDMCLTMCDANGICDTVNLHVEVVPNDDDRLPRAVDDFYSVDPRAVATVDPLENDLSLSPITFRRVVSQPNQGRADFLPEGTLSYALAKAYCGLDTMRYEICNQFGCDQAAIVFDNDCAAIDPDDLPKLLVYDGFSPNGDDRNETFTIKNIEYYPENELKIYNRWGTRVFRANGYASDWMGFFGDKPLPAGTYFYVLDLGNNDKRAGYLQLNR